MNAGWAVVGIIIVIAVVSAISQMLKSQQEQAPRRRMNPGAGNRGETVKTGSGDIDRFLQELDKLRKKQTDYSGGGKTEDASTQSPPVVSVVKPKQKPKAKPAVTAVPVKKAKPAAQPVRSKRVEEMSIEAIAPASPIFTIPQMSGPSSTLTEGQSSTQVERTVRPEPKTQFGKNLVALLSNPQSVPLAMILSEVLGPPKGKRRPG